MSIVWPVMYRWDDPTETDNRGKSFALSPLSNILRVRFFTWKLAFLPSSLEFKLVPEKLIEIGNL